MSEFFVMGGYGLYVWGAYGLTAALLIISALLPARKHRRLMREIHRRARRAEALQGRHDDPTA